MDSSKKKRPPWFYVRGWEIRPEHLGLLAAVLIVVLMLGRIILYYAQPLITITLLT